MIQLQSVLVPDKEICLVPELYFHRTGTKRIDFNGFFNLFYIEKRKAYTNLESLFLKIELKGFSELIIVHDGKDLEKISLEASVLKKYTVSFPYGLYDRGVFWFALIEERMEPFLSNGLFVGGISKNKICPVNIGIDICTYKREAYVERNLKQLKRRILDADFQVSSCVEIFVIDNGQTLLNYKPVQEIVNESEGKIRVLPNMNAGGAGGFTRGMLALLDEKEERSFTHILLMDDDALIEPDTLVRIFGFLSVVKEEWKNITVGGAMLREDYPYMLFCAGEWWDKGTILNPKMHLDLRTLSASSSDYLIDTGHEYDRYSGWWCCCYSLNVVKADNLPIPLFFHHDDIEFGLRNKENGIVFLNGIGVWHRGAEVSFPGSNIYYDMRNNLLEIALHQRDGQKKTAGKAVIKALTSAAIRLKYKDAKMVYRGFCDYLNGPEWLHSQNPELLNTEIRGMAYMMYSLDELKTKVSTTEWEQIMQQIQRYERRFGIEEIIESRHRKMIATKKHFLTYNGWLLPAKPKEIKVIFPTDSPFETYRKKRIVMYEPGSQKAFLLEKKYKELLKIFWLYVLVIGRLIIEYDKSVCDYKKNIFKITNKEAWEEYLNIR